VDVEADEVYDDDEILTLYGRALVLDRPRRG
jgi:hypothetical protein